MTTSEQIKHWQQAKKLIREGYGSPCKVFDIGCSSCSAILVASWIDNHIELLEWEKDLHGQ